MRQGFILYHYTFKNLSLIIIKEYTSVSTIFTFSQSNPFVKIRFNKKKRKKLGQKNGQKNLPLPLFSLPLAFFFQILSPKLLVEFLWFDSWNCLGGTKNDVYRRRLLTWSIYCFKKGI